MFFLWASRCRESIDIGGQSNPLPCQPFNKDYSFLEASLWIEARSRGPKKSKPSSKYTICMIIRIHNDDNKKSSKERGKRNRNHIRPELPWGHQFDSNLA